MLVGALACVASRATQTPKGRGTSEALAHRVDVVVALAHASVLPAEGPIALLRGLVRTRARGGGDGGVTEIVRGEPVLRPGALRDAAEEPFEPVKGHEVARVPWEERMLGAQAVASREVAIERLGDLGPERHDAPAVELRGLGPDGDQARGLLHQG